MDINDILNEKEVIYVFGYGSLTWKPDFLYTKKTVGCIKGYDRRFWQGSTYHRGTPEKPGRCLTLTKIKEAICWGLIYEVRGEELVTEALDYLNIREQELGGYEVFVVPVYTAEDFNNNEQSPMYSVVYVATPECKGYIGDASIDELANDIVTSIGAIGHNIEYLFRLADFMRENLPNEKDDHLFAIDCKVRELLGLSTTNTQPWKKLLEDPTFKKLVKPIDYKVKWKTAIKEMVVKTRTCSRWKDLLHRISFTKEHGISELETVSLGESSFISNASK